MSEFIEEEKASTVDTNILDNKDVVDVTKSIVELLSLTINSADLLSKINIKLTSNEINVINTIIKLSPDYFNDIEKLISEIVKDNKINSSDIPNIISLIQKLYDILCKLKEVKNNKQVRADLCGTIIKFIIHLLVQERKIQIDDDKKDSLLAVSDSLIDSCINLIKMPSLIKPKNLFNICFKK